MPRAAPPRPYNRGMFFRRERPSTPTFAERLEAVRRAGFVVERSEGGDAARIARGDCAIDLRSSSDGGTVTERAGVLMDGSIGFLVDGGFQKFFEAPGGPRRPATAPELKALHDFEEDLKEALGLQSYYNESLGTVSTYYLYDRLTDRDRGVPHRAWE
jgi:hypothetical protein